MSLKNIKNYLNSYIAIKFKKNIILSILMLLETYEESQL